MRSNIYWAKTASTLGKRIAIGLLVILALLPFFWLISSSFKSRLDILSYPPRFLFTPQLDAYYRIFMGGKSAYVIKSLVNSLIVALGNSALALVLCSLAALAFSRYSFSGRKPLLLSILLSRLLPPITAVIPLFLIFRGLGLVDTHLGLILILAALNAPFGTWLMKAFFDGIPRELEESAMTDGCSSLGAYLRVTMPLAAPGIAATSIFLFVLGWNEFMFMYIFSSTNARPMTVMLAETALGEFQIHWADMAAMASILVIPMLIFSLIVQKHIVRGLTTGALK